MVKQYMVKVYSFLIKAGKREIDTIPEAYQLPVAEYITKQQAKTLL